MNTPNQTPGIISIVSSKINIIGILLVLILSQMSFAQSTPANSVNNASSMKIKSLKFELEDLRKQRDQAVAKRWTLREKASQYRTQFEDKIESQKEKLDLVANEKSRILDEFRGLQAEMESLKQKRESHRAKYLRLSDQFGKFESLKEIRKQGVRIDESVKTQQMNQLRQALEIEKDQPEAIWTKLKNQALVELRELSEITVQNREVIRNAKSQLGVVVRLGGVSAFSTDASFTQIKSQLLTQQKDQMGLKWRQDLSPSDQVIGSNFVKSLSKSESGLYWAPIDVLQSANTIKKSKSSGNVGFSGWVQGLFRDGGPIAWPIAGLFVLAILISLERSFVWFKNSRFKNKSIENLFELVEKESPEKVQAYLKQNFSGALYRVLYEIFSKRHLPRDHVETLVEEALLHEIPHLEKRLHTISVLGGAAPLLGLLGTVYGMIALFDQITLHGTSDPKLLAGGISIALVTTQMGLAVAIPIQLIQNFISNRMDQLIVEIEKNSVRMLNHLWFKK